MIFYRKRGAQNNLPSRTNTMISNIMSNVKVVFRASHTATNSAVNGFVWQCGFELWPVRSFQKHRWARKNKCGAWEKKIKNCLCSSFPPVPPSAGGQYISYDFFFLSRALDGLRRENRGTVNRLFELITLVLPSVRLLTVCIYIVT